MDPSIGLEIVTFLARFWLYFLPVVFGIYVIKVTIFD